jgi:hypothetical protein
MDSRPAAEHLVGCILREIGLPSGKDIAPVSTTLSSGVTVELHGPTVVQFTRTSESAACSLISPMRQESTFPVAEFNNISTTYTLQTPRREFEWLLQTGSCLFFPSLDVCVCTKTARASVCILPRAETHLVTTSRRCISASTVPLKAGSRGSSGSIFPKTRRVMGQPCPLLTCSMV